MSSQACQVDFYVLQDGDSRSVEQLACHLALMAWEQGLESLVVAPGSEQASQLDELMWAVPKDRFLPHALSGQIRGGDFSAPVTIGTMADLDQTKAKIIINLEQYPVPNPRRFQRLLELVPPHDADRKASREKFRTYREAGLQPVSHNMTRSE